MANESSKNKMSIQSDNKIPPFIVKAATKLLRKLFKKSGDLGAGHTLDLPEAGNALVSITFNFQKIAADYVIISHSEDKTDLGKKVDKAIADSLISEVNAKCTHCKAPTDKKFIPFNDFFEREDELALEVEAAEAAAEAQSNEDVQSIY